MCFLLRFRLFGDHVQIFLFIPSKYTTNNWLPRARSCISRHVLFHFTFGRVGKVTLPRSLAKPGQGRDTEGNSLPSSSRTAPRVQLTFLEGNPLYLYRCCQTRQCGEKKCIGVPTTLRSDINNRHSQKAVTHFRASESLPP